MGRFQKTVMEELDRIDAFLAAVREQPDPALLMLRGRTLLTHAKELREEAAALDGPIAQQLHEVLDIEVNSLERVVGALKSRDAAEQAAEETARLLEIRKIRKEHGQQS